MDAAAPFLSRYKFFGQSRYICGAVTFQSIANTLIFELTSHPRLSRNQ